MTCRKTGQAVVESVVESVTAHFKDLLVFLGEDVAVPQNGTHSVKISFQTMELLDQEGTLAKVLCEDEL